MKRKLDNNKALEMIFAGNSTFTIRSAKTEKRFTFRIRKPRNSKKYKDSNIFWVSVLTGCNNETDYTYMGMVKLDGGYNYIHSKKNLISIDTESYAYFYYAMDILRNGKDSSNLEIWHEGRCCRCNRTLTTPESIELGIGPECLKMMGKDNKRDLILNSLTDE